MKRAWWLGLLLLGASSCEEVTGPSGYLATFDDVAGLKPGGPVYVAGVKVGRVKSVALEESKAKVEFVVEGKHGVTMTDAACVSVGRYAFDTETHIALVPSKGGAPLDSGAALSCVKGGEELTERVAKVSDAMVRVLEAALEGEGTMGKLLMDPALANQVVRFFEQGPPAPANADEPKDTGDEEKDAGENDGGDAETKASTSPAPASPPTTAAPPPVDLKDPFED
ncbi:MAG TPA: MCE family protein [Polyangiaceae bacterium]|nr:MCE family protein [Polyangiaceae bacterium]